MYLLDTNVVSELRKPKPHGGVLAWLESVDDTKLYLSAVTLGEIQAGVEMTREQDAAKAVEIEVWLELVASSYNVLPMDAAVFRRWARLMHRTSNTLYEDAMIAATADVHGLTVVTRNVADFKSFGVPLLNPFAKAAG
ncbi:MAG: VapC toxin family PIN domain ribonuclease [Burkholderiales bacterium PBB3]|nr:MAG: VapC toxin family PIN domain ribonuclease [Burkholderiales bacterium PBB3]